MRIILQEGPHKVSFEMELSTPVTELLRRILMTHPKNLCTTLGYQLLQEVSRQINQKGILDTLAQDLATKIVKHNGVL